MMDFSVFEKIKYNNESKLIVIGVDGLSRSGKTTYVNMVEKFLVDNHIDHVCLHLDDFIEKRSKRYNTGFEEWEEYYFLQWNVEKLRKDMFEQLRNSTFLKLQFYDGEKDVQIPKDVNIPSTGCILIEGVFLQRKEWKDYFDCVIYLNCDRETRFRRESELTQSRLEKFKKRYWKAEDYYLMNVNPEESADYIINT
ncbi:kinase [[Bacillus] enclensis]|uniref:kinase n=1 Tax=[Bacillus] enclensis TaxID=1402860 RepID=UPI003AF8A415